MELRAACIYLHKNNPGLEFDELAAGLKEEKGKKFGEKEIESAYIELQNLVYIP